jgi:hypothetical protein
MKSSLIVVEHSSGIIETLSEVEDVCKFWNDEDCKQSFPAAMLSKGLDADGIRSAYSQCLKKVVPKFTADLIGTKVRWENANKDEIVRSVVSKICEKLGLSH